MFKAKTLLQSFSKEQMASKKRCAIQMLQCSLQTLPKLMAQYDVCNVSAMFRHTELKVGSAQLNLERSVCTLHMEYASTNSKAYFNTLHQATYFKATP